MKLEEKHKVWLVAAYASYKRTGEVRAEFAEAFGTEITESQARMYNMTVFRDEKEAAAKNRAKWWPIQIDARKRFEESIIDIPIASKAFRVRKLDEMFDHHQSSAMHFATIS